jgi:hypothetical protein
MNWADILQLVFTTIGQGFDVTNVIPTSRLRITRPGAIHRLPLLDESAIGRIADLNQFGVILTGLRSG